MGYHNTLLRYYLHVNPDDLSDGEWAQAIAQLADIRKREAEASNPKSMRR